MYLCQLLFNSLLCVCPPVNRLTTRLRKCYYGTSSYKTNKGSWYNSYCLHIGFIYISVLLYYISIINDTFIHMNYRVSVYLSVFLNGYLCAFNRQWMTHRVSPNISSTSISIMLLLYLDGYLDFVLQKSITLLYVEILGCFYLKYIVVFSFMGATVAEIQSLSQILQIFSFVFCWYYFRYFLPKSIIKSKEWCFKIPFSNFSYERIHI